MAVKPLESPVNRPTASVLFTITPPLSEPFPGLHPTVTDALACGTPLVATALSGIPKQVKELYGSLIKLTGTQLESGDHSSKDAIGVLVLPRDPEAIARGGIMLERIKESANK